MVYYIITIYLGCISSPKKQYIARVFFIGQFPFDEYLKLNTGSFFGRRLIIHRNVCNMNHGQNVCFFVKPELL